MTCNQWRMCERTLEVPKPKLGFVFLIESVCVPNELIIVAVVGPGDNFPYELFSCSLEMKIFPAPSRVLVPILAVGSVCLVDRVCVPCARSPSPYVPAPGKSRVPSLHGKHTNVALDVSQGFRTHQVSRL